MASPAPLFLAGVGFVAEAVAEAAGERRVVGTTRSASSVERLSRLGIEPLLVDRGFESHLLRLTEGADVLVSFPPDGHSDASLVPLVESARRVVYVSSTGVYGETRGVIDNRTPAKPSDQTGQRRLDAEDTWRSIGATVIRAPGIYGPGRGLHRSILSGAYRLPGDGTGVISRIHVHDLARVLLAALESDVTGGTYVVADLCPVPQLEVVEWLCERLGVPMPPSIPIEHAPRTMRGSRAVDSTATLETLGVSLQYPSYREGFAACLAEEQSGSRTSSRENLKP